MKCLVTGGAGFIGSNLVHYLVHERQHEVLTIDKLTYAGHIENLASVLEHPNHHFTKIDITNTKAITECINNFKPDVIFHLAAETHVDRSIDNAFTFVNTNILGTQVLIDAALEYWKRNKPNNFKYIQISTDEVFGALGEDGKFTEQSPYDPNSPYSASKAGAELLVKAYCRTHGLPIVIANCSNNYGPYQYPEKLIPLCILNALEQKPIPAYGDGKQIRDWLYVTDHIMALDRIAQDGQIGETYCIGGDKELTNIEVITTICNHLDNIIPRSNKQSYTKLITHVADRPGHDWRYAIDASKINTHLNWKPQIQFTDGIEKTIAWYLANQEWINAVSSTQNARIRRGLQKTG